MLSGVLLGLGLAPSAIASDGPNSEAGWTLGEDDSTLTAPDRPEAVEAPGDVGPMIVSGTRATSSRGMAAVLINEHLHCSGSIVHNRWVLTAKHCVMYDSNDNGVPDTKYPASSISVRVKSLNADSGGGVVRVSLTKVRASNDIAMLKLDRSANAEPVRLASANPKLFSETYAFGWGAPCKGCGYSSYLKRATQRVSGASSDLWGGEAIRVNGINGNVCHADSGGPLFKLVDGARYQVGVLSSGDRSCGSGSNHYSSVPRSKAWIEDVIARF
ncbi:S1 family peptidase [Streptomyces californicus]|uniref:S1 family peptidase n=1 Tax=Streptomyces californicus TaxID=67351 RepID=UPI0036A11130